MPWKEVTKLDQKINLINDYLTDFYTVTDLSRKYEISRKTIYKWINRFDKNGVNGLRELPRTKKNLRK